MQHNQINYFINFFLLLKLRIHSKILYIHYLGSHMLVSSILHSSEGPERRKTNSWPKQSVPSYWEATASTQRNIKRAKLLELFSLISDMKGECECLKLNSILNKTATFKVRGTTQTRCQPINISGNSFKPGSQRNLNIQGFKQERKYFSRTHWVQMGTRQGMHLWGENEKLSVKRFFYLNIGNSVFIFVYSEVCLWHCRETWRSSGIFRRW